MLYRLQNVQSPDNAFWSSGNKPTQESFRLDQRASEWHFRALLLCSNKVLAAASFFYESEVTREITSRFEAAFMDGDALFFISEEYESVGQHAEAKQEKSPGELKNAYVGRSAREHTSELEEIGNVLLRPNVSISEIIRREWLNEVASSDPGGLNRQIRAQCSNDTEHARILTACSEAAARNTSDFVWDAVRPRLESCGASASVQTIARRRLAQIYAVCMAASLNCGLDNPDYELTHTRLGSRSATDTSLFASCMRELGVLEQIKLLTPEGVLELKRSGEWVWFMRLYRSLIQEASDVDEQHFVDVFRDVAIAEQELFRRGIRHDEFLEFFRTSVHTQFREVGLKGNALDVLRAAHSVFDESLFRRVKDRVYNREVLHLPEAGLRAASVTGPSQRGLSSSSAPISDRLRVLFLAANPLTTDRLRLDREFRDAKRKAREASGGVRSLEFESEWAVTVHDLQGHLLRTRPDIVHFSGHGSSDSRIVIESDSGDAVEIETRALSNLIGLCRGFVSCVVLNCCYSERQARAISAEVGTVIGCNQSVGDDSAVHFASAFYRALAYGEEFSDAFRFARNHLELLGDQAGASTYVLLSS